MKHCERKTNTTMLKYEKNFQNKNLKSCYNETRNKIKKEQEERKVENKKKNKKRRDVERITTTT